MPKEVVTSIRVVILATVVATILSRVQTHAQATVADTGADTASTPARAVSSKGPTAPPPPQWVVPKALHPWAMFEVGSWREIEITTETFDEQGQVFGRSVTTQKEILKAVADDSYVIDVQATVDVAGKRIAGPWNTRVLRLSTDRSGPVFSTSQRPDEVLPLTIGTVSCHVFEVNYVHESRNLCDRLYFSPDVFPHVLRRDTVERSESSLIDVPPEDSVSVIARAVPLEWEGKMIECATQQSVRRRGKGESQAFCLLSAEVPGGEIRSHATDFDSSGRRIRWSVQRLLAYGTTHSTQSAAATAAAVPLATKGK